MMSKSSYSVKDMLRSRIWTLALSFVTFFLYDVAGTAANILRIHNYADVYQYTAMQRRSEVLSEVSKWLGVRQYFGWIVVIVLAVVTGISGYAWMDNRQKTDFFESQPVRRSVRFWKIYFSGLLVFLIPAVLCLGAGLLTAAAMGCMTSGIMLDAWVELVRLFILYAGVYAISVLAAMWTGNAIVCAAATGVLLLYEPALAYLLRSLKQQFLVTYYAAGTVEKPLFSPVVNYMLLTLPGFFTSNFSRVTGIDADYTNPSTVNFVRSCVRSVWKYDILTLAVTAAVTAIAFLSHQKRRSEDAGSAVVFASVRVITKLAVATLGGLYAGLGMMNLFASGRSHSTLVISIVFIVITVMLLSAVIQIIYDFNFRSFMRGAWSMAAAGIAAVTVFLMFRGDVLGYDRYVPKDSEVGSAAIVNYGGVAMTDFAEDGSAIYDGVEAASHYMMLTDIADVTSLARMGQEYTINHQMDGENTATTAPKQTTYQIVVLYRMKNGRRIYRQFTIPADTDASLLDRITSSEEYRKGYFNFLHDEGYLNFTTDGRITYDSEWNADWAGSNGNSGISDEDYAGLKKALSKDAAQYCYSKAREEGPIGMIQLARRKPGSGMAGNTSDDTTDSLSILVYPFYQNTIQWLKDAGIWSEPVPSAGEVSQFTVTDYNIAALRGEKSDSGDISGASVSVSYTEPDQIARLLQSSVNLYAGYSGWYLFDEDAGDYTIDVKTADGSSASLGFRDDKIPAFVRQDLLNKADQE